MIRGETCRFDNLQIRSIAVVTHH